jgi:hypothetical protein
MAFTFSITIKCASSCVDVSHVAAVELDMIDSGAAMVSGVRPQPASGLFPHLFPTDLWAFDAVSRLEPMTCSHLV